jgi:hypothetical protein
VASQINPLPSQSILHDFFDYSLITGDLYWRSRPSNRVKPGAVAGSFNKAIGYTIVGVNGKRYFAHRLIWKWVTGSDPQELIDHIDRDSSNNAWHNLREATVLQNAWNTGLSKNNSTGYKGVNFDRRSGVFNAMIMVKKELIYLGRFYTAEEAHAAYLNASSKHHGEFVFRP